MNMYFGKPRNPRIAASHEKAETPVGEKCLHCDEPIAEGDDGFLLPHMDREAASFKPWHMECFLRTIYGSIGHQMELCSCHGGNEEDPVGMSKREAARVSVKHFERLK